MVGRLELVEDSIALLGSKLDTVFGNVNASVADLGAKVSALDAPRHDVDLLSQLQSVSNRIERIELLLLRTSLPDFKVLDDAIATMREASDISVCTKKAENKVNISINPDYIDQFCIEEVDTPEHVKGKTGGSLSKTSLKDYVCAARCCKAHDSTQCIQWYTCPCCDALCCSLSCYSSHCKLCTERFYHEEVLAEPRSCPEQIYPLTRLEADDLDDLEESECGEDVLETPVSVSNLKDSLEADALDERQVEQSPACGDSVATYRQTDPQSWYPWWQRAEPDVADGDGACARAMRPNALKPPVHLCCMEGRKPHASVALTSLSAVYAYVHTMRAFNGGWEWAPWKAAPHLLHICPAICEHQVFNSVEECLHSSLEAAATLPGGAFGVEFDLLCLADACALVGGGGDYCACALQDIVDIFEACLAGGGRGYSAKLRRGLKKLEFLTSFTFHHYEILQPLVAAGCSYAKQARARGNQKPE